MGLIARTLTAPVGGPRIYGGYVLPPVMFVLFLIGLGAFIGRPVYLRIQELGVHSIFDGIWPFYPLMFLPLFAQPIQSRLGLSMLIESALAILVAFFGAYSGIQGLIFLGGAWSGLALAPAFGRLFHRSARLLLVLVPPFSGAMEMLVGFPLRIRLSQAAANIMNLFDPNTLARGNTLYFQGGEFVIDPACEGLKLLIASVLLLLLLLGREDWQDRRTYVFALFAVALAGILWLTANLARISILVLGDIRPESWLHGFTGIALFILMIALPLLLLHQLLKPAAQRREEIRSRPLNRHRLLPGLIAASVMVCVALAILFFPVREQNSYPAWPERLAGLNATERSGQKNQEIISYRRQNLALILKYNDAVYRVGHNPSAAGRVWDTLF